MPDSCRDCEADCVRVHQGRDLAATTWAVPLLLLAMGAVAADPAGQTLLPGFDEGDVIVATIRKVSIQRATKGNPPLVQLEVHEVLRGDPKIDRQRGLWAPMPHDVDYTGGNSEERIEAWESEPMNAPKVGGKWILWGEPDPSAGNFFIYAHARFPFSEELRARVVDTERGSRDERRRRAASDKLQMESRKRAFVEARAKWRAQVGEKEIRTYFEEADFVVKGSFLERYRGLLVFRKMEVLKGRDRNFYEIVDGERFDWEDVPRIGVRFHDDKACEANLVSWPSIDLEGQLTDRTDRIPCQYLLFLSERGLRLDPMPVYRSILSGDGIVVADAAALLAIREAARDVSPKAPRPVLVVWSYEPWRTAPYEQYFERAAADQFLLLRAYNYREGGFPIDRADRDNVIPPGGNAMIVHHLKIHSTPNGTRTDRYILAVRLEKQKVQVVLEEYCDPRDESSFARVANEAVRRLLDPKFSLSGK